MYKKTTKRALFSSMMSLILCFSMLVGTTFAWFTDEVTSNVNTIVAGNLDIVLEYWNGEKYAEVTSETKLFNDEARWEPGYTEVVYLKVTNAGSLALKYQLSVNVFGEIVGKTKDGEDIKLSEHLLFKVVESESDLSGTYNRETAQSAEAAATKLQTYISEDVVMEKTGDVDYVALIVYMPETVGNEANHNGVDIPSIQLGVRLFATQHTYEKDSFDETYDDVGQIVSGYDALVGHWGENGSYVLSSDFTADDYIFFGEGTQNTIDLNGNTITAGNTNQWLFVGQGEGTVLTLTGDGNVNANKGVFASSSGKIVIDGGTYQFAETGDKSHLYAQNSATIVINDGTFISTDANTPILYCINGFIEINGGFFQNTANPNAALLSMGNNLSYVNNQKITLRGGTFVNWNPMNSAFAMDWPQCPALIVLAEGYTVVSETQENGDIWYSVIPVESAN